MNVWEIDIYNSITYKTLKGGAKTTKTKNGIKRRIPVNEESRQLLLKLYSYYSQFVGFDPKTWYIFDGKKPFSYTTMTRKLDYYYELLEKRLGRKV